MTNFLLIIFESMIYMHYITLPHATAKWVENIFHDNQIYGFRTKGPPDKRAKGQKGLG